MEGEQKRFLHGTLEITIFDATRYTPPFPFSCMLARGRPVYVTIKIDNKKVAKTSLERDRVWNQTFQILCAHPSNAKLTITLKTNCSILGKFQITGHEILNSASLINGFFPLVAENGKPKPETKLRFMLWFKPAELEPGWSKILNCDGQFPGIRSASFPQRSNCRVTLYQDAHHTPHFQPHVGIPRDVRKLWEDVYRAIEAARHLVYIAGWSVNPKMVLVRDPETEIPHARGVTIGELLKRKAEEGVAVRVLLWNDETSLPLIKNKGIMATHDEDAFAYFRTSKVICRLCPRSHNKLPTAFAHHQKTITVDMRVSGVNTNEREIMSFVGGLDLCDGRYDTEEHSLFRTLNTESHCSDFYQTNISGASLNKGGPRVPWHDCHACVVGEAAWDVLANFEQRWTKQCDPSLLINTSSIPNLVRQPYPPINPSMYEPRNWNVQVFRSIDHVSATQMPKGLSVERSIHEAYVEAIRRAEKFIYIENQYFMGSCFLWGKDTTCGCNNLIPVEIALKIANKIRAKERFAVYILIPMWPEGVPESEQVQDILHWTRETMAMMYKIIGEAIKESGDDGESHPRDYLNFFCLANREEMRRGEFVPPSSPHPSSHYWKAQKNRRFMVYVHSKLMIVDDAYVLIGSANINQRSMDGQRDTEIAIGCYQTPPDNDAVSFPNRNTNNVRAYRLSLWDEHTGAAATQDEDNDDEDDDSFDEPESTECVRRIRSIGEKMWRTYSGGDVVDMGGAHLVAYPIHVTRDGDVEDLVDGGGSAVFPDTKTPVKGRRAKMLPPVLTT